MTTAEIARRSTRHLSVKDPDDMEPSQAIELVDAINEGVNRFFELAPDIYKRTTLSELLNGPVSRSVSVTEDDDEIGVDSSFLSSERGRAIAIPGDPTMNEIVGTRQMLRPYRGATGTYMATIYSDAVAFRDFKIERIMTAPRIVDTNSVLLDSEHQKSRTVAADAWYRRTTAEGVIGDPKFFKLLYVGGTIATGTEDAVMIMQLDPIPGRKLTIEMDVAIRAVNYGITALSAATEMPIHSSVSPDAFQPLVEYALMASSMWVGTNHNNRMVENREREARTRISLLPTQFAPTRRKVRTKPGY